MVMESGSARACPARGGGGGGRGGPPRAGPGLALLLEPLALAREQAATAKQVTAVVTGEDPHQEQMSAKLAAAHHVHRAQWQRERRHAHADRH